MVSQPGPPQRVPYLEPLRARLTETRPGAVMLRVRQQLYPAQGDEGTIWMLTAGRARYASPVLSVDSVRRHTRRSLLSAWVVCLAFTLAFLIVLKQQSIALCIAAGFVLVLPLCLRWLWLRPVRGIYLLTAAATLLEQNFSAHTYIDDIGGYIYFFQDIQSWTHIRGPAFSVAELFIVLMALIWLLKGIAARNLRFDRGTLMRPLGLYMLMVLVGEAYGLESGGNFTLSLWEVRSQIYMLMAYLLACNLVRTWTEVSTIINIFMVGTGLKGLQGVFRYYVSLHGNLHSVESILPHEQSFFFNLFIIMAAILFLYDGPRRLKRIALVLLPFVVIAALANQRRAAVLALLVGALFLLLGTAAAYPRRRKIVAIVLLILAAVLPIYYEAYKNSQGLIGEPAHAISSAFTPDQRDASSNLYRVNEDKDLMATMQTSPIIGFGYGKEFLTPFPLADISGSYVFYKLMPHDSILWVWMRLGTVGYLLFWFLIGSAIIQAARLARLLRDPYLKGIAMFCTITIVQEVIFGYLDLQWTNYRNLIIIGVLFAVIGRLHAVVSVGAQVPKRRGFPGIAAHPRVAASAPAPLPVVRSRR